MSGVDWNYFDKFKEVEDKYLPCRGEGETMATQLVTAITKLIYKWYNDGDVFDNTHSLPGWANDLSSYANWLDKYVEADIILDRIFNIVNDDQYELLLKDLADTYLGDKEYLEALDKNKKVGSIYECDGKYEFRDRPEDDDEDWI